MTALLAVDALGLAAALVGIPLARTRLGRCRCGMYRRAAEAVLDDYSWRATMLYRVETARIMADDRAQLAALRAARPRPVVAPPACPPVFVPQLVAA